MDFDDSMFDVNQGSIPRRSDGMWPEFMIVPEKNERKSAAAGRPIFDDREKVKIHFVGDKKTEWYGDVTDQHKQQWQREYASFKAGLMAPIEGTPLTEWPLMSRSQAAEFGSMKVRTVEELAAMNDSAITSMGMGARTWVERAKLFLQQAKDGSAITKIQKENDDLKATVADMGRQISELMALLREPAGVDAEGEPVRRGPGRPRKAA